MNDAGFVLFDIVAVNRSPLDLALAQMDAVFVPKTSRLRQMGPPGTVNPKLEQIPVEFTHNRRA
jgi:hypothetical protein